MGACTFFNIAHRKSRHGGKFHTEVKNGVQIQTPIMEDWENPDQAFDSLCADDRYQNGHSYSGGIGMKTDFVKVASVKTLDEARDLAAKIIDNDTHVCTEKYGPAGLIEIESSEHQYVFFGWASC